VTIQDSELVPTTVTSLILVPTGSSVVKHTLTIAVPYISQNPKAPWSKPGIYTSFSTTTVTQTSTLYQTKTTYIPSKVRETTITTSCVPRVVRAIVSYTYCHYVYGSPELDRNAAESAGAVVTYTLPGVNGSTTVTIQTDMQWNELEAIVTSLSHNSDGYSFLGGIWGSTTYYGDPIKLAGPTGKVTYVDPNSPDWQSDTETVQTFPYIDPAVVNVCNDAYGSDTWHVDSLDQKQTAGMTWCEVDNITY